MSIDFKIKITRKLILVSRPPIHFRIKQAMFDQFWKSCINSWWFTSAALSLQFLKIKCSMKRSRGIWNSNNQRKIQTQELNILHSYGRGYPGWSRLPRFTVIIDPINPHIFEFLPCVHFFKDFQYKTFRDFLCFQIALTWSMFELEKCSFFFKQVRISPEIDWLCYPWATPAKMRIVPAKLVEF